MSKKLKDGFQKQRLFIPDSSYKGNDLVADINWNKASIGKYIRITLGKKTAVVKKDHLLSILFMLGSAKEQDSILSPFIRQIKVHKYTKMIGVTTTHDVKKGQPINLLLEFTLNPETNTVTISKGSKFGLKTRR